VDQSLDLKKLSESRQELALMTQWNLGGKNRIVVRLSVKIRTVDDAFSATLQRSVHDNKNMYEM